MTLPVGVPVDCLGVGRSDHPDLELAEPQLHLGRAVQVDLRLRERRFSVYKEAQAFALPPVRERETLPRV